MDLNFDFFNIDKNLKPKKGRILISEPFLQDIYFKRSVVLLTEHTNEGSIGFVLNKPSSLKINEVINDFPVIDSDVTIGGPVATDTIHFCHTLGDIIPNSMKVINNIYWGGDFNVLNKLIKSGFITNKEVRFFIGYSGWGKGQLDRELSENSWIVADLKEWNMIVNTNKDFWKDTIGKLGEKYKMWANYPENPVLN